MKRKAARSELKHYVFLEKNLTDITSAFGRKISSALSRLSPREVEICTMVRQGLTNKEIAKELHLSPLTVDKHRIQIRHKLGLSHKQVNLVSFLQAL